MRKESEAPPLDGAEDQAGRVFQSRDLFGDKNEILIAHEGAVYRMKITRQGKLILNK